MNGHSLLMSVLAATHGPSAWAADGPFWRLYEADARILLRQSWSSVVEEDDLATAFYENERIDLGHLIMEQFQLAVPMKPLCTDECRGLCPQCGTNLNTGTCDCSRTWEDPRLAALKNLKT